MFAFAFESEGKGVFDEDFLTVGGIFLVQEFREGIDGLVVQPCFEGSVSSEGHEFLAEAGFLPLWFLCVDVLELLERGSGLCVISLRECLRASFDQPRHGFVFDRLRQKAGPGRHYDSACHPDKRSDARFWQS